jgi:hypothetical protein
MALLFNFHPFGRKIRRLTNGCQSPFEQLNGFRYLDHWLRNLLIVTPLNGKLQKRAKLLSRSALPNQRRMKSLSVVSFCPLSISPPAEGPGVGSRCLARWQTHPGLRPPRRGGDFFGGCD